MANRELVATLIQQPGFRLLVADTFLNISRDWKDPLRDDVRYATDMADIVTMFTTPLGSGPSLIDQLCELLTNEEVGELIRFYNSTASEKIWLLKPLFMEAGQTWAFSQKLDELDAAEQD